MDNKKKNIVIFIVLFLMTNLIFLPWLINGHLSTDSYNISNIGYQEYNKHFSLIDGRFVVAIGTTLMDILNVPIRVYSSIILEVALLVACIAIVTLKVTIEKWKKAKNIWSEIILVIASYYTIFNFLYIENLHFIECGAMSLSLLLFILAAKQIVEKNRYWIIKSFLLLCVGLMCYQGTISMFVLTLLVFSICKGKTMLQVVKDFLQGMLIALGGILVSQLSIKVVEQIYQIKQTRDFNFSVLGRNLIFIFKNIMNILKDTGYLIPRYSYLIVLGITEVLMILKVVRMNREKPNNKNANIILEQFVIITIGIGAGFLISVMNTAGFWAGRSRFSIAALIGFLWIHLWVKTDFVEEKRWINALLILCLTISGFLCSIHYITVIIDHHKLNEIDRETVLSMQEDVIQYEETNHITVTKVAIVTKNNQTLKAFYPNLRAYGNIMMSSGIKTQWAAAGCYNYYADRKLMTYEPTKAEEQEYLEQNKEYLCMGDTLYITTYMY